MEEPAPGRQDAAVNADGRPFYHDLGVGAVKLRIEEEAPQVGTQLAEAQDLEVGPTLRLRGAVVTAR